MKSFLSHLLALIFLCSFDARAQSVPTSFKNWWQDKKQRVQKHLLLDKDQKETLPISIENNDREIASEEQAAEDALVQAQKQQQQAHEQLLESAAEDLSARRKRYELERENVRTLMRKLEETRAKEAFAYKELLLSDCRYQDFQTGEFIHLTTPRPCLQKYRIGLEYGTRIYNFTQEGSWGGLDTSSVLFNKLKASGDFSLTENWLVRSRIGMGPIILDASTDGGDLDRKYLFDFAVFLKRLNFVFGVDFTEAPALRYRSKSNVEWTKITTGSFVLGYEYQFAPFFLEGGFNIFKYAARLGLPVTQFTGTGVETSKPSGFRLEFETEATRSFFHPKFHLGVRGGLKYQNLKFDGSWRGNEGGVTQKIFEMGLELMMNYTF